MQLCVAILLCWSALQGLVQAGDLVRGLELLWFYEAYRMDVEVSAALARADGKDPDKSWKLARASALDPARDFKNGVNTDPTKLGANFIAFMKSVGTQTPPYTDALNKIADPWNPTRDELKNFADWKDPNKFFQIHMPTLLGSLAGGEKPSVVDPKDPSVRSRNNFFLFENMLGIVGKRVSVLYEKNPTVAKVHMERLQDLGTWAQVGRTKEAAGFEIKILTERLVEFGKGKGLKEEDLKKAIQTKTMPSSYWGDWNYVSATETRKYIQANFGDKAEDLVKEFERTARDYRKADAANKIEDIDKLKALDANAKDHLKVTQNHYALKEAFGKQLGGSSRDVCGYPQVVEPKSS